MRGAPRCGREPAEDEGGEETESGGRMEAVHSLRERFREVVLLHYYQGYGITEIAQMLSLPEGTISSRLSRARSKLENILKEGEEA